ncbi:MAG: MFS transporter [Armatimonadota bacterium]|nr:MFS transporter [Armatimonadota bacterium]
MAHDARAGWRIHALGVIALGALMSITVTSPVIPLYLDHRGLPAAHVGGVIGALSLTLIVTELMALAVSARIGRRAAAVVGLVGSAVMFAWFPLTASLAGLYLTRLLLGAVRGILWPVVWTEVAEAGPPERRPAILAIFWVYFGVGQLLGPAVGGVLGQRLSLTAPFFAAALISVLAAPAAAAVRPIRDGSGRALGSYRALIRGRPGVVRMWALTACSTIAFSVYATFMPLHAAGRGRTEAEIGLIFTAGAMAFIVAQAAVGRLGTRVPENRVLAAAFLARGVGVAITTLLDSFPALLAVNVLSSAVGAAGPHGLSVRVAARTPREHMVAGMGGFNAAADAGFFLGPVAGGVLAGNGVAWAFALAPAVTVAALGVLAVDARTVPRSVPVSGGQEPIGHHGGE